MYYCIGVHVAASYEWTATGSDCCRTCEDDPINTTYCKILSLIDKYI